MEAIRWGLVLLAVACGVYWLVVAAQVVRTRVVLPTLRRGLTLNPSPSRVCIIVPAHNEEGSITGLVESLRRQDHPDWTAVLALDRCTDATADRARTAIGDDPRITVLEVESCPEDWAGKVHAVWSAVANARPASEADTLLFIDADTAMHAGCVRAATALLDDRGDDLLSVLSTLEVRSWYERIVQCVAGFELTSWYPPVRASRRDRRRPFANGQFLLFRRSAYEAIGGHEAVREHLLEDLEFARRIHAYGFRGSVLLADGMHRCRMYDDWPAFVRGWKRIYTECANRKVSRLRGNAWRLMFSASVLPAAAAACLFVVPWVGAAGLVGYGAGLLAIAWAGRVSPVSVAAFPVGAVFVGRILLSAADELRRGVPTQWAGRSYARQAR